MHFTVIFKAIYTKIFQKLHALLSNSLIDLIE